MIINLYQENNKLKREIEELNEILETRNETIDFLTKRIDNLDELWKKHKLSKYYTINNEFIGRIEVEYERREFCYDFCKYEIDNDFLIVFAKENIYYFKKEKVDNFLIKYYKEGEKSDEVGKEKTIIQ